MSWERFVLLSNEKGEYVFLVTDHLRVPMAVVIRRYDLRWDMECYFRDAKHHLGLGDYQMRSLQGIGRHRFLQYNSRRPLAVTWFSLVVPKLGVTSSSLVTTTMPEPCHDISVGISTKISNS